MVKLPEGKCIGLWPNLSGENLPGPFQIERMSNSITDNSRVYSSRSIVVTEVGISDGHLLCSTLPQVHKSTKTNEGLAVIGCERSHEDSGIGPRNRLQGDTRRD